jgi:hypothetical protein
MRRHDAILRADERVTLLGRLDVEDIESSAAITPSLRASARSRFTISGPREVFNRNAGGSGVDAAFISHAPSQRAMQAPTSARQFFYRRHVTLVSF